MTVEHSRLAEPYYSMGVLADQPRTAKNRKPTRAQVALPRRAKKTRDARPPSAKVPASLRTYRAKRNFDQTGEPAGGSRPPIQAVANQLFVIQKHAASHLHYDFRLAMEGVLKSWAVPKGVPWAHAEKRLAMQVEDHPLEYARFEGTIAPGNYGAGTVMVWDIGRYEIMDGSLASGKLHLRLDGQKLHGEWILVHAHGGDNDPRRWLLIKGGESATPLTGKKDDSSALTHRSMAQIAHANDAQWVSNREATRRPARRVTSRSVPADPILEKLPRAEPAFVAPMLPKHSSKLPKGEGWTYELKFDGYRAVAVREGDQVSLLCRPDEHLESNFPAVAEAVRQLPGHSLVLDGELVALDAQGKPSQKALQRLPKERRAGVAYYVFDLLHLEGRDLRELPLNERRRLLQGLVRHFVPPLLLSDDLDAASPEALVDAVRQAGLGGIVAKKTGSRYEPGKRSAAWVEYRIG